ncbi:MAG: hypothetical protein CMJ34_13610 [Phycisphaerae bacterium]|nr:hypothetical protein [Phycisphaerae bacterium]
MRDGERSASSISWEAIALATLAALRFLSPFAPDRLFDVDPAGVFGPFPAVGPSGAAFLDVVILIVAAIALWRESRRDGLDPWIVGLGLIPLPILVVHGAGDLLDGWRGSDWFAAVVLGAALAHLVRLPGNRRMVLSILLAAVAVGGVRGFHQVFWEHADTVAYFEANRDQVLASRGWAEGSPAALAFERRLRQPEATGWIGFSNVFSGLSGAAAVALVGIVFARRSPGASQPDDGRGEGAGGPVMVGLVAVCLAILVGINGSKGAIGATLLGVIVLGAAFGPGRDLLLKRPWIPVLASVGLVLAVVVARGMMGDDFAEERSLLFRWQYLVGAWGMAGSAPLLGVGPDGFQAAYLLNKPPTSPENVASAHSMGIDWIASLGMLGIAWLALALLICSRRSQSEVRHEGEGIHISRATLMAVVVCIAGYVGYEQLRTEWPLDDIGIMIRLGGLAIGVLVGIAVWSSTESITPAATRLVGLASAVVVLAHAQVEMLFWQPASLALAWVFLAAGGSARSCDAPRWRFAGRIAVTTILLIATGLIAVFSVRAKLLESQAAMVIAPLHRDFLDDSPVTDADRLLVAGRLVEMVDAHGWYDVRTVRGAMDQFLIVGDPEARRSAIELADRWFAARPGPESAGLRSTSVVADAGPDAGESGLERALAAVDDAIRFDPTEPRLELVRCEILLRLGRRTDAAASRERVESLDAARALDPLMQLGDADRRRLEASGRSLTGSDS